MSNSYITAASTPEWVDYGYVFQNCRLSAAEGVDRVYLGRPWRDYAQTVFLNCEMGDHIVPEGWHNWGRPATEETTFYAEYKSKGPGASPQDRVKWSHQLSDEKARAYTLEKVFSGTNGLKNTFGFSWYGYEKDTSFNLNSAYQKDQKQFPHIKKVEERNFSDLRTLKDLPYKNVGYREHGCILHQCITQKVTTGDHSGTWWRLEIRQ